MHSDNYDGHNSNFLIKFSHNSFCEMCINITKIDFSFPLKFLGTMHKYRIESVDPVSRDGMDTPQN